MGKKSVIILLLAGFVPLGRAQSPAASSSPGAAASPPASPPPAIAAPPAPTPAPVVETHVVVSVPEQKLAIVVNGKVYKTYRISTSRYGEGDSLGSWCTPTGHLAVAMKIGATVPNGGVFEGRRFTGEILSINAPGRDPIVSRIIWLRGLEYGNKNAYHRCIYIHGTPQEDSLGKKASYGCIRMASSDVIEVFNWISSGTEVSITDKGLQRGVKDVADDRRLMATTMIAKPDTRSVMVR